MFKTTEAITVSSIKSLGSREDYADTGGSNLTLHTFSMTGVITASAMEKLILSVTTDQTVHLFSMIGHHRFLYG